MKTEFFTSYEDFKRWIESYNRVEEIISVSHSTYINPSPYFIALPQTTILVVYKEQPQ